jgi:ribosomal protein L11 methyltransferase
MAHRWKPARRCSASNNPVAWLSIRLCTAAAQVDALCDALTDAGALAVTLCDAGDAPVLEPGPGETPLWPEAEVDALFPLDCDLPALRKQLAAVSGGSFGDGALDVRFVEDSDWSQTWRNHTNQYCFGDRLWVVPRDAPTAPTGVVLRLDPGLAFGTGGHATTALCLEWLARQPLRGWSIVDYGAGSGILGIAALLLGAAHVTAVDHDPQALVATRANATYNGITSAQLVVVGPEVIIGTVHDLVLANILAGPLMTLAPQLTALVKPGGKLVLSGLLIQQQDAVVAHYPQFEFAPAQRRDSWVMLEGTRAGG